MYDKWDPVADQLWNQRITASRGGDNETIEELTARDPGVKLCLLF
jgi:hypothetical protein